MPGVGLQGGVQAGCSGVACHHQGWCVMPDFGGEMRWGCPCAASVSMADQRAMEAWTAAFRKAGTIERLRACARRRRKSAASLLTLSLEGVRFPQLFPNLSLRCNSRICLCIAGAQLYTWWHTCAYHVHERCHSANPCVSFLFVIVQIGWWSHAMNLYVSDGGHNTTLSRKKWYCFFWYRKSEDNFGFGRPIKRYLIWLDSQKRYNIGSFPNLHAHHDLPAWVNESKLGDHFGPVNSAFFENISVQDSWNYNGPMILDILDEYTLQVRNLFK